MKKPISARIDEETLIYIKGCKQPINTLINELLKKWMKNRQDKELLIWKEDTGQDELSKMKAKENFKCKQYCKNCIYFSKENKPEYKGTGCKKLPLYDRVNCNEFVCIYWEKKKGSN